MAKRLRKTKRILLKKQQTYAADKQCKEGSKYEPTVDDFREFALFKDIDD